MPSRSALLLFPSPGPMHGVQKEDLLSFFFYISDLLSFRINEWKTNVADIVRDTDGCRALGAIATDRKTRALVSSFTVVSSK